ncbi:MAG: arginase family protein [Candidatus Nanoarchaeia archaeon]
MQIIKIRQGAFSKGCEKAADEVVKELKAIKCKENGNFITLKREHIGEVEITQDINECNFNIEQKALETFYKNDRAFFVGGDHSISYSILKSFFKKEENGFLIVFDAHLDCKENNSEIIDNNNWLRKTIQENNLIRRVLVISSRNYTKEEIDFLKERDILLIKMDVLGEEDLFEICDMVMQRARASSGFYVSIDIDSVDPGFAPGTNEREAGGLTSRQIIYFAKKLSFLKNFRGADICEINPKEDINEISIKLGARILAEMM